MSSIDKSGTYALGSRTVKRLGYGAMQLAGPGVFGPPKDKNAALDVLREAVAAGVNHIDRLGSPAPSGPNLPAATAYRNRRVVLSLPRRQAGTQPATPDAAPVLRQR